MNFLQLRFIHLLFFVFLTVVGNLSLNAEDLPKEQPSAVVEEDSADEQVEDSTEEQQEDSTDQQADEPADEQVDEPVDEQEDNSEDAQEDDSAAPDEESAGEQKDNSTDKKKKKSAKYKDDDLADQLEESFIEFRFRKTGDPFYRVMMSADEEPYLNLKDIFKEWLSMKVDCDIDRKFCQLKRQPDNTIFWIDGHEGLLGSEEMEEKKSFSKDQLIVKDQEIWIKYSLIHEWMNITVYWSVQRYQVQMLPHFRLVEEIAEMRERSRMSLWAKRHEREMLDKAPAIKPEAPYRLEARTSAKATIDSAGESKQGISYDAAADILKGNLQMSGNYDISGAALDALSYLNYRQVRQKSYNLLELGDTSSAPTQLLPSGGALTNGIRLDKNEKVAGVGKFEYRGRTDPDTEIDVYINGFLEETLIADADGNYEIRNKYVAGGDQVSFYLFLPDGSEDQFDVSIAPDNGMIIDKGTWDASFVTGQTIDGSYSHFDFRYGLFEGFSSALHLYQLPKVSLTDNVNLQEESTEKNAFDMSMDFGWRPFESLGLTTELMNAPDGLNYSADIDITKWENHNIHITSQKYTPESSIILSPAGEDLELEESALIYATRYGRFSFTNSYVQTSDGNALNLDIGINVHRDFRLFVENSFINTIEAYSYHSVSAVYRFSNAQTYELILDQGEEDMSWEFNYEYQGTSKHPWSDVEALRPWRLNASVTQDVDGELVPKLQMLWTNNRHITTVFSANRDSFSIDFTFNDATVNDMDTSRQGWLRRWRREDYEHYSMGTLEGYLISPEVPGEKPEPLKDVEVRVGSRRGTSDEDGFYRVSGIVPGVRQDVRLDMSTLDASMAPLKDATVIEMRPTTILRYDPELTWTAGIDGVLYTDQKIPKETLVRVTRNVDGKIMSTTPVETDGFFLVEGLIPGVYSLAILGVSAPPPVQQLEIPAGTDWVGGVQIEWLSADYKAGKRPKVDNSANKSKAKESSHSDTSSLKVEPQTLKEGKEKNAEDESSQTQDADHSEDDEENSEQEESEIIEDEGDKTETDENKASDSVDHDYLSKPNSSAADKVPVIQSTVAKSKVINPSASTPTVKPAVTTSLPVVPVKQDIPTVKQASTKADNINSSSVVKDSTDKIGSTAQPGDSGETEENIPVGKGATAEILEEVEETIESQDPNHLKPRIEKTNVESNNLPDAKINPSVEAIPNAKIPVPENKVLVVPNTSPVTVQPSPKNAPVDSSEAVDSATQFPEQQENGLQSDKEVGEKKAIEPDATIDKKNNVDNSKKAATAEKSKQLEVIDNAISNTPPANNVTPAGQSKSELELAPSNTDADKQSDKNAVEPEPSSQSAQPPIVPPVKTEKQKSEDKKKAEAEQPVEEWEEVDWEKVDWEEGEATESE